MVTTNSFQLVKTTFVKEINSEIQMYEHLKTGAQLMFIKNDDNNKVFSITFKTPPHDDTGCPHILEHSVLNGSKHFPAKDTFNELCKGSMNTFLNAFTDSVNTSYPVASTNEQDFFNLMEVYLDAVFYPNIHQNENILKQEGWHYELFSPEDPIVLRGVVYNEMKGAFSSPESVLYRKITHTQNPDTPFAFESGGDPEVIPQLTWEQFKAFHKRFYHPSNSYIFLYGDLDLEKAFDLIDGKYLKDFDKIDPHTEIPAQPPFPQPVEVEDVYSIGEEENPDGKCYLSLNYSCGHILDAQTNNAMDALKEILMDTPASPLKMAIQKSNLCADSFAYYCNGCTRPFLSIICKHVAEENIQKLTELINAELNKIAKEGIDRKLIEAVLNRKEFVLRECDLGSLPKGLFYNWLSLNSWIQGGDPLNNIAFDPILTDLRKGLTEPKFEQLIDQYLLHNNHSSRVILKPVKGLVKQQEEKTRQKLDAYKASLTQEQIDALIADNLRLQEWQSTPDRPEDLAKIPFISLSDIKKEAEKLPLEVETTDAYTLLKHDLFTNGIVYFKGYFDLSHQAEDDLPWLSLVNDLIGNLDTEHYTFSDLNNEIGIHTGGIYSELVYHVDTKDPQLITKRLVIHSKCISAKVDKMVELVAEILFKTIFQDKERIHQLIKEMMSRLQMNFLNAGHVTAIRRMYSQTSRQHKWLDETEGMAMYDFLSKLDKQMTTEPQKVLAQLTATAKKAFQKKNLVMSLTAPETEIQVQKSKLDRIVNEISFKEAMPAKDIFVPKKNNEGIIAPVNIQFCAQGGNYQDAGYAYKGQMMVLENILRNDFLMQELRVKGGAYGIMVQFSLNGLMHFCSYRDPNLKETLQTYGRVADYLRNFSCSPRDFEKYIIGTMSVLDIPLTVSRKASVSDTHYLTNYTYEDKQKVRDEVLSATIEDIRSFASLVEVVINKRQYAVLGTESKIRENSELFDSIIPIIPNG
ncbi:MAG TPA: insulinase family protein [Candidatus Cloacimonadota bacterium]|nr:insulinase family protein [Candidatus Cloacimonadota bacterium]